MNRTLLVSLLKKNIDELILLTEGFAEMSEYPAAIIVLAKNKTDDIRSYIDQLGSSQKDKIVAAEIIPEETPALIELDTIEIVAEEKEPEVTENEIEVIILEKEDDEVDVDNTEEEEEEEEEEEPPTTVENIIVEKKITIAEKIAAQTMTRNELHAKGETTAMNDSIAHKKIEDIRQAISLGDRFRFQRELFNNNGEEMNKMLSYINLLASYDEIVSFLQSKYGWDEDHPVATDFYQIIKRKF